MAEPERPNVPHPFNPNQEEIERYVEAMSLTPADPKQGHSKIPMPVCQDCGENLREHDDLKFIEYVLGLTQDMPTGALRTEYMEKAIVAVQRERHMRDHMEEHHYRSRRATSSRNGLLLDLSAMLQGDRSGITVMEIGGASSGLGDSATTQNYGSLEEALKAMLGDNFEGSPGADLEPISVAIDEKTGQVTFKDKKVGYMCKEPKCPAIGPTPKDACPHCQTVGSIVPFAPGNNHVGAADKVNAECPCDYCKKIRFLITSSKTDPRLGRPRSRRNHSHGG